ncbi:MAG: hypothetical protein LBC87_10235 [Fibromonadaceae bacterium]|jgi:hypothetical protein|nr:hypothetical protein [Fibromonadaceae bacterium]
MPYITAILKKVMQMTDNLIISVLIITLLNLGLVTLALVRINDLRKDLRTPVVKKFNADFKRKPVDIPRIPENFAKTQRDDNKQGRSNNQQSSAQNRPKNNPQQNRPMQRRPAAKVPDVYSNELASQAHSPVPPRPVAAEAPAAADGGRRPLPPRFNAAAELAPPAPVVEDEGSEAAGMEFDRSKMAHGRRNVVAKPVIEDDNAEA